MSINLHDELLHIATTAAEHAQREARLEREIRVLNGRIAILTQELSRLMVENRMLRKGIVPASAGDSR